MVWDLNKKQAVPLHREQVGYHFHTAASIRPHRHLPRQAVSGREVDVMPVWQMYLVHFQDFDLDTVHQITVRRRSAGPLCEGQWNHQTCCHSQRRRDEPLLPYDHQ